MEDNESYYDNNGEETLIDPTNNSHNQNPTEEYDYILAILKKTHQNDAPVQYKQLNKKCRRISLSSILFIVALLLIIYCVHRSTRGHAYTPHAYTPHSAMFESDPIFRLRR